MLYMVVLTVFLVLLTVLLVQGLPPWLVSVLTRVRDACRPRIPSEWSWQQLNEEDDEDDIELGLADEDDIELDLADEDDIEPDLADEALAAQRAAIDRRLQALDDQVNANYVQARILEEIDRGNLPADPWGVAWPQPPAEVHAQRLALRHSPRHARVPAGPST
jgi:hypothetical protein